MEIQSSLTLGSKAPSKMISDRLSNASGTCSGKHSGTHGHPHMGTRWSALLLSPWKQWETVNAFTDTSGSGAGKQPLQIVCCRPFMVNSDQRTRLMDGAERGRLGGFSPKHGLWEHSTVLFSRQLGHRGERMHRVRVPSFMFSP